MKGKVGLSPNNPALLAQAQNRPKFIEAWPCWRGFLLLLDDKLKCVGVVDRLRASDDGVFTLSHRLRDASNVIVVPVADHHQADRAFDRHTDAF